MLPPGVPPDRVEALRRAFDETLADPAFRRDAGQMGFEIAPRTGEEIEALIRTAMATPPEIIAKVSQMTQGGN